MALALFDLDNTLLNGDSDHAWGIFLTKVGAVDKQLHQQAQDHFYQQYVNGSLDIYEFLAFQLKPLTQFTEEQLYAWRDQFMTSEVEPMIADDKVAVLEQHKAQGDKVVIITATNDFITRPIANKLGVDTLIATQVARDINGFTGKITGTPCFQEGKVTLLNAWLDTQKDSLAGSWFYSDSYNDLPLLQLVDNPVAVTPDERLRTHAQKHHWKVID